MRRALFLPVFAGLLLGGGQAPQSSPHSRVTVLLSQDADAYRRALEGFQDQLRMSAPAAEVVVHRLAPNEDAPALIAAVRQEEPGVVLALGSAAVELARQLGDVPVVAGMVLRPTDVLRGPQFTGVFLEFPLEVEFWYLAHILPGQRRVAVLYNPAQNQRNIENARRAARESGLELLARRVLVPSDIPASLQSLSSDADVIWGLADTLVLTPGTARPILLFSLQNGIPFVGQSAPWVRAGAVYALERDYWDIGRQCAELVNAVLDGMLPAELPPVRPRKILYYINRHTADKLKLTIPRVMLLGATEIIP